MTRQIGDSLLYNGREYSLQVELLEPYFKEFPEKKPATDSISSDLWRGYIATFEIKDDQLYISKLEIAQNSSFEFKTADEIFPGNNKFSWFSGLIRIDQYGGYYGYEGEDHIFEYLEIYEGNLVQKRVMEYEEFCIFKEYQYDYFKTTENYQKLYTMWRTKNPQITDERIDEIIYENLINWYSRELFDNPAVIGKRK